MTSAERRRQLRVAALRRRELVALRAVAERTTPAPRAEPASAAATAADE